MIVYGVSTLARFWTAKPYAPLAADIDLARATDANVDFQWISRFDLESIRIDSQSSVRMEHLDVVQSVRRIAEVKDRDDLRRVDSRNRNRCKLGECRANQTHGGLLREFGAGDRHGYIAIVATGSRASRQ